MNKREEERRTEKNRRDNLLEIVRCDVHCSVVTQTKHTYNCCCCFLRRRTVYRKREEGREATCCALLCQQRRPSAAGNCCAGTFVFIRRAGREMVPCDTVLCFSHTRTPYILFFLTDSTAENTISQRESNQAQVSTSKLRSWSAQTCKTEGVLHLTSGRRDPVCPEPASKLQQRSSKKLLLRHKTKLTAISSSMLAPPSRTGWAGSRRIVFPPTTFRRHHQPTQPNVRVREADKLRIRAVLPSACCVQDCSISVRCSRRGWCPRPTAAPECHLVGNDYRCKSGINSKTIS